MVAPNSYDVTIYVNDVDVSAYVPYGSMEHDDNRTDISYFRFTIEKAVGVTPTRGHIVKVVAESLTGDPIIFLGNIIELETHKRDNGITVEYTITAADYKHRLAKTVVDIASLTGTDADIIAGLLSNAYPDLSALFDFSGGVSSITSGLDLAVGNKSILEALKDLSDLAGGADYRFDNVIGTNTIDFDGGLAYTTGDSGGALTDAVTSGGNPGNCLVGTGSNPSTNDYVYVEYDHGSNVTLDSTTIDYWADVPASTNYLLDLFIDGSPIGTVGGGTDDTGWTTNTSSDFTVNGNYPALFTGQVFRIRFRVSDPTPPAGAFEFRLDNITFNFNGVSGNDQSQLKWDSAPDAAVFDFDIDTSDEFGFDFNLYEGDYNNYNSITIIGGNEELAIDWTYPNQDGQKHVNLETHISSLAVFTNSGSEGSPSWTALDLGDYGTDENGVAGIDVLYDPTTHWLYFNTAPPNFYDAVRVTGNILKPIRVRVENIAAGEATYADTYQDDNITSQEQAVSIGVSKLDQRNAAKRLTLTTHNPGLKVGQLLTVTDSNRGLSESLVIQRMNTRWLNNLGIFTVECGDSREASAGVLIGQNEKRSKDNQLQAGVTTVTIEYVYDDNGVQVFDDRGRSVTEG